MATPKERQVQYRTRLKEAGNRKAIQFTVDKIVIETIDKFIGICGDTRAEVLENAITTWACDSIEALPAIKLKMGITQ